MSKLKAIAIHGPPVVVDAVVLAFRRMQFRMMKAPKPDFPQPKMVVEWDPNSTIPRTRLVYPKPDPEKEMETRAAIRRGASIIINWFASDDEYHCSLRAFKAAWKGIPLCEAPRC